MDRERERGEMYLDDKPWQGLELQCAHQASAFGEDECSAIYQSLHPSMSCWIGGSGREVGNVGT